MLEQTKTNNFLNLLSKENQKIGKYVINNNYKKGQTLFSQGNPSFGLFCLVEGKIKISHIGEDGSESILSIVSEGDPVELRSLFGEKKYFSTATALENCVVRFVDKKYILNAMESNSNVSNNIISHLCDEMKTAQTRIASMSHKNVRERLAEMLLSLKAAFGKKVNSQWMLDIKLSRTEMASMIGVASETLIRFLSEFRDDRLISEVGKKIFILDEQAMAKVANVTFINRPIGLAIIAHSV